ncbi:Bgt-20114, partial [Blumeria graminis f. sp. tritici]
MANFIPDSGYYSQYLLHFDEDSQLLPRSVLSSSQSIFPITITM